MPVVNTSQARVELSGKQVVAFINLIHDHFAYPDQIVMISIEETNMNNTIAVQGIGMPETLINHEGVGLTLGHD